MTLHQANRLTVTCDYCSTVNDMLVVDVVDQQEVTCSRCGGRLGRLGELRGDGRPELSAAKRPESAAADSSH